MNQDERLGDLLGGIARPHPPGGGGAAAALVGATAAALVAMVGGVAARHAADGSWLREIAGEADALRERMLGMIGRDVAAYGRVMQARRRRDATRADAVREALVGATEVPLELAAMSARVLEQSVAVLPAARPSTVADLGVAATLALAALESAAITARANLDVVDAPGFVADGRRRLDRLVQDGAALRARLPRHEASGEPR
jgi:formiminotetrahydrofolate cyclodeaminase